MKAATSSTQVAAAGDNGLAAILDGLKVLGVDIAQNISHFVKVVADNFQVGSSAHPTGITMYDRSTGAPYCFQIDNGEATTTPGACTDILPDTTATSSSQAAAAGSTDSPQAGVDATSSPDQTSDVLNAPVLSVIGDDPAHIGVGDSYTDLGATITGPQADLNLGIQASVDGGATTTASTITIDTSSGGTHTIVYSATDGNGLVGTAIRTVVVSAPAQSASTTADAVGTSATP